MAHNLLSDRLSTPLLYIPGIIHMMHCSSKQYSLKIIGIIHTIHIGVRFFLLSKFLPVKVQWRPTSYHFTKALWMKGVWLWACCIQEPHPTVYETARAAWKELSTYEIWVDEKTMFARWRGWLFIPSYESICVGFWRFLDGSLSSQWISPGH